MKLLWTITSVIMCFVVGSAFEKTSSTFLPELLPGMDCTCVEITKCPSVWRSLQAPKTSEIFKRRVLKNITCGYKGTTPYVCCDEKVIEIDRRRRDASMTIASTIALGRKFLDRECGDAVQERIIGGNTAALGAYPWIARLGYTRSGESRLHYCCGGSLINDRYVITAAHCVPEPHSNVTLASIRLGEVDEDTDPDCDKFHCADPVQDFSPEEIKVHTGYDNHTLEHDIALIRLNRRVNIGLYASPICLPLDHSPKKNYVGQKPITAGWGLTSNRWALTSNGCSSGNGSSRVLKSVRLPVVSRKQCAQAQRKSNLRISESQICAGGENGKDSCKGDSGGPLMLPGQNGAEGIPRYVLIGLVSYGPQYCGSYNKPGVYTKISAYIDWILDNLRD